MNDIKKLTTGLDRVVTAASDIVNKAPALGPRAGRRLTHSVGISATAWLLAYFAARAALEIPGLATPLRVLVAVFPLPAFAWFLWTFIRMARDGDELERRIQLEALAVSFPLTLLLVMTLGLLQLAVALPPEDWSYRHIWPLLYVFYLLGLTLARRRYA
jgi:hypothetical protein